MGSDLRGRVIAFVFAAMAATAAGSAAGQTGAPGPSDAVEVASSQWIAPRSRVEVYRAAQDAFLRLGLDVERDNEATGVLVSRWRTYDTAHWPSASALGLPAGSVPREAAFHVFVAPALEPARISVAVAVDSAPAEGLASRLPGGRVRRYDHGALAAHFLAQLRESIDVDFEPLAERGPQRDAQARRLLPAGLASACGVGADPVPIGSPTLTRTPRLTSNVRPHYPLDALAERPRGTVILRVVVGADGTVTSTADAGGIDDPRLRAEAHAVAALWRFLPGMRGTCPVAVRVVLELTFTP